MLSVFAPNGDLLGKCKDADIEPSLNELAPLPTSETHAESIKELEIEPRALCIVFGQVTNLFTVATEWCGILSLVRAKELVRALL